MKSGLKVYREATTGRSEVVATYAAMKSGLKGRIDVVSIGFDICSNLCRDEKRTERCLSSSLFMSIFK